MNRRSLKSQDEKVVTDFQDCLERFHECVDSFKKVHDEYKNELKGEHDEFLRRFSSVISNSQRSLKSLLRDDSNNIRRESEDNITEKVKEEVDSKIDKENVTEFERNKAKTPTEEDVGEDFKTEEEEELVPRGKMVIIFTDIQGSTKIWQKDSDAMLKSLRIHNEIIKKLITKYHGYEVKTEGDSFMIAFQDLENSINFCIEAQFSLLNEQWPKELDNYDDSRRVLNKDGVTLFVGLRIRIGAHYGKPVSIEKSKTTGRFDYFGPMVNRSSRIQGIAHGGEILVSKDLFSEISGKGMKEKKKKKKNHGYGKKNHNIILEHYFKPIEITNLGKRSLKGFRKSQCVFRLLPQHLRERSKYFLEKINPRDHFTFHSAHRKFSAPPKFRPGMRRRFSFGSNKKKKKNTSVSILARQNSSSEILMYASSKKLKPSKNDENNNNNNNTNNNKKKVVNSQKREEEEEEEEYDEEKKNKKKNPVVERIRGGRGSRRRRQRKRHSVCIMNKQGLGGLLALRKKLKEKKKKKKKINSFEMFSFQKLHMILEKEKRMKRLEEKKKKNSKKMFCKRLNRNSFSDFQRLKKEKKMRKIKRSKTTLLSKNKKKFSTL